MLDDLKAIHERDAQDALGLAEKQWQQYQENYGFQWQPPREIANVVVAGMGGSGLAAKAFRSWPEVKVPFEVVQGYELPDYVQQNTLVIASSYSGNTEETVACLESALADYREPAQQPMVVVVASGGLLEHKAREHSLPFIKLPSGYQPRMTFGYQLRALCEIFDQTSLVDNSAGLLQEAGSRLKDKLSVWLPIVPAKENFAKQLALECVGKSAVIYAGPKLAPAAYKWKISFNENAKNVAWWNQFPEFNHNEFLGWTSHPVDKPYTIIELRSSQEHPRVQKRFEVSGRLLSGKRPAPHIVQAEGESLLDQLLWTVALGDFVSLYTALLNGLNPTPVDLIEQLKTALSDPTS